MNHSRNNRGAFTLVELIVVVAIIGILGSLIVVVVNHALEKARSVACVANLRQIGVALAAYAGDHQDMLPYGPKAGPFNSPANLYPSTGAPTSLLSLHNGSPAGLGLLLDPYLAKTPDVLFCPGCRDLVAANELSKVGKDQAQGGYYYRHAGNTQLFDNPRSPFEPKNIRFSNLGENRQGRPVRALVMDTVFACPPELGAFNVAPRSNHNGKFVNVLYVTGDVISFPNMNGRFTVDATDLNQLRQSFSMILSAFEQADAAYGP
jgi:prepilin-type N-terminal cleavage/methylation domain-containing protein